MRKIYAIAALIAMAASLSACAVADVGDAAYDVASTTVDVADDAVCTFACSSAETDR